MTNHIQLSAPEAQFLTDRAVTLADELARTLVAIHDGNGHKALGYSSWRAYCAAHFEPSLSTIYRMMRRERARDALADCVNLTRFTNGALEALADPDIDHMRQVADIAAKSVNGDIGKDAIKLVQETINQTMLTGAVELSDGSQVSVKEAMTDGVRGVLREDVLSKRHYIVGAEEAWIEHFTATSIWICVDVYTMDIYHDLADRTPVKVSIWREP